LGRAPGATALGAPALGAAGSGAVGVGTGGGSDDFDDPQPDATTSTSAANLNVMDFMASSSAPRDEGGPDWLTLSRMEVQ
jgi:hypothetical protein